MASQGVPGATQACRSSIGSKEPWVPGLHSLHQRAPARSQRLLHPASQANVMSRATPSSRSQGLT
eukprot:4012882-Amphidinium_carterae.1